MASRQNGVVSREQLEHLGITRRVMEGMLGRGELRSLFRGTYLVGPVMTMLAREAAAVLVCGATAVLSHRSAAFLYELHATRPVDVDVTVVSRHPRRHRGIRLHRTGGLASHEIRHRSNIPVTAPPRTLIDLAASFSPTDLEGAVAEAFALRLTNRSQLLRALDRAGPRRGTASLRRLLDAPGGPRRTRSKPERRLLTLIRDAGLPEPETNVRIGRWEVDFFWREAGFVLEVDAYSTHSSPWAFERDRRKSAELEDLGLRVHRVTSHQLGLDPNPTIGRVRRELGA